MRRTFSAFVGAMALLTAMPVAHDRDGSDQAWWWIDRDDDNDRDRDRDHDRDHGGRDDVRSFRPIANFNVPGGSSAEIVSASRDGRYLVYSDAIAAKFGLVDIANPRAPRQVASLDAGGSPTSVAVLPVGNYAVGCVQPGRLILIDLSTFTAANSSRASYDCDVRSATDLPTC
jgi:hypothetical protein